MYTRNIKTKLLIGLSLLTAVLATGCANDADVASQNISLAADNFQIERRIVFMNTWTDTYLLSITGLCSVKDGKQNTGNDSVAVTCKTGANEYKKHYLGLSGNVTYFSEQLGAAQVGVYHYKVIFKPESILPDIDLKTSVGG